VQQLPTLSEAEWQKQFPAWRKAVDAGKKTADEILAMAGTRWSLTVGQSDEIMLLGAAVAPDGEIIDAVAVDRGDAWEPAADVEGGAR
jgi:hypothetical protein